MLTYMVFGFEIDFIIPNDVKQQFLRREFTVYSWPRTCYVEQAQIHRDLPSSVS